MSANVEETEMTTQTDAANSGQTVLVHAEIGADGALRPVVAELLGAAATVGAGGAARIATLNSARLTSPSPSVSAARIISSTCRSSADRPVNFAMALAISAREMLPLPSVSSCWKHSSSPASV